VFSLPALQVAVEFSKQSRREGYGFIMTEAPFLRL
jgi:hypothetical protein